MRANAFAVVVGVLLAAPLAAAAKECVEPMGEVVQVSEFESELRIKPECKGLTMVRKDLGAEPTEVAASKPEGPADVTLSAFATVTPKPLTATPDTRTTPASAVGSGRPAPRCSQPIGRVVFESDVLIEIGFKPECRHLRAPFSPVVKAAQPTMSVWVETEPAAAPKAKSRGKSSSKAGTKSACRSGMCDDLGTMGEPPSP